MNTQSTDSIQIPEFAAYVGLDWGDKSHAWAWTAGSSKTVPQTGSLVNSPEVLHAWLEELGQRWEGRPVALAVETSRGPLIHPIRRSCTRRQRRREPIESGVMNRTNSLESIHPAGEDNSGCALDTLGGLVTVERTDQALTPYGGLAAWSALVGRMGTFERLAERCPVERTSPNAAPVREVLHSFAVSALIEGRRFRHVGWVQEDPGVAAVLGLERVRGEDALPRLARRLSGAEARSWLSTAETELYRALPERFIGDWDSTVHTR